MTFCGKREENALWRFNKDIFRGKFPTHDRKFHTSWTSFITINRFAQYKKTTISINYIRKFSAFFSYTIGESDSQALLISYSVMTIAPNRLNTWNYQQNTYDFSIPTTKLWFVDVLSRIRDWNSLTSYQDVSAVCNILPILPLRS